MKVLSIVSGGFDPLHVGHLELFENSKLISTDVLAIINTDDFLTNDFIFMTNKMTLLFMTNERALWPSFLIMSL